jgi:cytochrome P450
MYIFTRNGKGIAMSTGRYWRFVRKRLQENISRAKPAAAAAPIVLSEVQSVVHVFRGMCQRGENITNLTMQLKRESMNVAMQMIFSTRFGSKPTPDFLFMQYAVEYFFKNLSSGNPGDMIPIFRVLPTPMLWEMQKVVNQRDEVLGRLIGEHKREFRELRAAGKMETEKDARDMLDLFFLDEIHTKDKEEELQMTADKIHVSIWDMIFAMTDTTASTNEWLIYYMINHPDVQRKVQAELDSVCRVAATGEVRLPILEDGSDGFSKLPYFWATIKEVMRIRTISPVLAPHYCSEDVVMSDGKGGDGKVTLPRGTQIFVAAFSMANDPKYWKDPHLFNPDRWLEHGENEGLDVHGQEDRKSADHYKFIPFSMGPRTCPGYSFAKVSLFLQAAAMMQCFEWQLSDGAGDSEFVKDGKLDMTENWGLTIMPRKYGEMGLIKAVPRPAAALARAQDGDD